MGHILLVGRLALRDLRRHRIETGLLLLVITAAAATLTLGLSVRDAASDPYQSTREATNGPDVIANVDGDGMLAELEELASSPGVVDHSGPFPVTTARLELSGRTSDMQVMGRDTAPASVDQPELIEGNWASRGGMVVEAAFAEAFDIRVGESVTLNGRPFDVVGTAVTAATPPFPQAFCFVPCSVGLPLEEQTDPELVHDPGLAWLIDADARSLNPDSDALVYTMNLKLDQQADAQSFVDARLPEAIGHRMFLGTWEDVRDEATELAADAQIVLVFGAWLLAVLAIASISVLVGGRIADQARRVGLLKAAGATPKLVAAVLLAEYVLVAIVAAAAGLTVGSLTAPLLTKSSAGLIGAVSPPPLTAATVGLVTAVALGVAVLATLAPAMRAARTSTVSALADSARPPRRTGWLIAISSRLPVPLLLALRVAARRPRRIVLGVVSIAITVSGIVVALAANAELNTQRVSGSYDEAQAEQLSQVLLLVMVALLLLAAANAVFITWATVLDNRHSSALARALGATPRDVSRALAATQVLPALAGAVLGIFPGSFTLFAVINGINDSDNDASLPPAWQLMIVVAGTVLVVAALTAIPARLGAHRSVSRTLQAELA